MSPRIETNASVLADSPCPSEEGLRELLEGREGASDRAWLVGHLDACAPCQHRLQSLAASDDFWSKTTRTLREQPAEEYGELQRLMSRLQTRVFGADDTLAPYPAGPAAGLLPCSTPGRLGCLGPYEVVEVLGRGGMGVVYKAVDPALDRTVAIKVMACAPAFNAEARARFRREARAAAMMRSVYAVVIHAVEETAESPYLVMEFVDGHSLQERLDRSGPLEIDEILRIGAQTARGLAAAHAQGLIHRDVKPANILLEAGTGTVKISDFGLAKAVDAPSLTQAGTVSGTPEYMAPEQASDGPIDHRVDLFSLGSVLYAACTGRPPFRAERSLAVLRRTREETPVPIRQLRPEVPEALIAIIEKLHRKDPNARHANAAEVADAIDQLQAARAAAPLARASGRGAGGEGTSRRRVRWALLAGSLLLVAAFSASELAGLTAITSWAVAPVKKDVAQEARVSPVEGLQPDIAVPQPANREPILLAAAPPANVKGPAPEAAPAAAKMAADADDSRPQQITALRLFEGHTGPVSGVAISLDGKRAVSCSGYPQGDATVRLWDVASGKEVRRLNADRLPVLPAHAELANPSGEVWTVAFSPDGRHVLFGGANGVLGLWSVHDGAVVRRFVGHKGVVHGVAISRDGKLGLSGGADRTVRLWDMGTGKEIQRMMGHTDFVRGVAFSPDGTRALSGSKDHTMRFWDLKKGEQHREPFLGHPDCVVWSMAFLPDGQQAISGDATIRLWDLAKDLPGGRQLRTFDGHTSPIYDVTLSPDGLRILSCSVDRTVRLWDRATGREIATLVGHRNFVQSVAFSPDGRYALSGGGGVPSNPPHQTGNDYALRLWELP